jgi:hypothetical protein
VRFAVTSDVDRSTVLWRITATVADDGASVAVTADDSNTQTPPPQGWYWYLVDVTTGQRIGEGPLVMDCGPLVT